MSDGKKAWMEELDNRHLIADGRGGFRTATKAEVAASQKAMKPTNPKDMIGIKKAALSCVPLPVLVEIGTGMMEGALKYGRHNYRAMGVRASVYFDATIRHLFSWWEGEDMDPDTDNTVSHISKAITSLVVLRDAMIRGKMEDDRAPATPNLYAAANKQAEALVAKYGDRNPRHYTIKDIL
jgi:hypothetical protein